MSWGGLTVSEICDRMNARAESLVPMLLPNGRYTDARRRQWQTSSIDDLATGRYSLVVDLSGPKQGRWRDYGGCRSDEERGDVTDLVRLKKCGGDMKAAIAWAKVELGLTDEPRDAHERARDQAEAERRAAERIAEIEREEEATAGRARVMWFDGWPLHDSRAGPALAYLRGRGIDLHALGHAPGALRFHPEVKNLEARRPLPALLGQILRLDGKMRAVHRTWIEPAAGGRQWRKHSGLAEAKKSYGPGLGGHIPLWKGVERCTLRDLPPHIRAWGTEGIEDGLSWAMKHPEQRVVSVVSLSKMAAIELPEGARFGWIGDNDPPDSKAVESRNAGIGALQLRGHEVATDFPPPEYKDFNAWLQADRDGMLGNSPVRARLAA